uniref:RNase H type-1 domain-containing protein n=1 Tax=Strigamia maritima TaxID=126957 RepID=T1ITD9_STRMM
MFWMLVIDSALKALSVLSDRIDSALRLLVLLQNAGTSVRFMWIPSHIGVPGNEAADMAAKAACSVRSDAPVFGADLLALLRRQVLGVWQSHWDRETENKLFQIKPKIVSWQSAFVQSRRDEVALCRLRIGHCRLTHESKSCAEFFEWLFKNYAYKNTTVIVHYSQGYDNNFVLRYILERGQRPELIMRGQKILFMCYEEICFVDSLCYLASPLASLPGYFGITSVAKGYFPHFLNKSCNQDYEGEFPDPSFYGVDQMTVEKRSEFFLWYESCRGKTFNME